MATVQFDSFLEEPNRDAVILAEIVPREELQNWTLLSGSTVTWQLDFPTFVQKDVIKAGIFRDVVGITDENQDLVERSNTNEVEANPGSWFYSEKGTGTTFLLGDVLGTVLHLDDENLFVHLFDGGDPNTSDPIFAKFRLHFGTKPKVFSDIFYEPRVTSRRFPSISEEREDMFFGPIKKVAEGQISLSNADGLFDKISAQWAWKDAEVTLYLGGDGLSHTPGGGSDYETVGKFFVESFSPGLDESVLALRDAQKFAFRRFPITPVFEDQFPNVPEESRGSRLPILFGAKKNITPIKVDPVQKGMYAIADFNFQTLFEVTEVRADGVVVPSTDLEVSLVGCTFTILNSFSGATPSTVICDAIGQPARGKSWETSTDYLKFYGEIVSEIYTKYLGLADSLIDAAAAKKADKDTKFEQAAYIDQERTARSYIRDFEAGVLGQTIRDPDGTIHPTIWIPSFSSPTEDTPLLEDPEVRLFSAEPELKAIFSRVFIEFDRDPTNDSFQVVSKEDARARFFLLGGSDNDLSVRTFLRFKADADVLARRIILMTSSPSVLIRLSESGFRMMASRVGDGVRLTLKRGVSETGKYQRARFEIVSINKIFAPVPSVEVLLRDFEGLGSRGVVGLWTDSLAPIWTNADEEEKKDSGFWLNQNNFAEPTDESSKDVSIWW